MQKPKRISLKHKLDFFLFGWIVNLSFQQYYRPKYAYRRLYKVFFYNVIPQKVFGINRKVPWPVHFTSVVSSPEKIKKGIICDPGDSMGVYIQAKNGITFGSNIEISPGCKIISSNHNSDDHARHDDTSPIVIGNNVLIYSNAVILPGVNIGDNVVIGAGSVVTKDIPSNSVAVGNPCKVIKELGPYEGDLKNIVFNRRVPEEFQAFLNEH